MRKKIILRQICSLLISLSFLTVGCTQEIVLYPGKYKSPPGIASPSILKDGTEIIISLSGKGEYSVLPVTHEKGGIYSCLYGLTGKGDQTWVDVPDFRSLGKTGLHSDEELDTKTMITGRPIEVINYISKPGRFSHSGFIAEDEDIISVLKGDNRIVGRLGLTHSMMAKPLFHIWNAILGNYIEAEDTVTVLYNSKKIFIYCESGNGYQESVFHDEIEGKFNISIRRDLDKEEYELLRKRHSKLTDDEFASLIYKLSHIQISEMVPFYIMRYGFYEGHTAFRADPLSIATIFGLKAVIDIDSVFNDELYKILNQYFSR